MDPTQGWTVVRSAGAVLVIGGIAAMVVARKRRRLGDRRARSLLHVGIGSLALGTAAAMLAVTALRSAPPRPPGAVATITDERFESPTQPAIRVVAPPGWRVSFDAAKQLVTVRRGEPEDEDAAALVISSAVLTERVDLSRFATALREQRLPDLEIVEDPRVEELAGRPALRSVLRHPQAGVAEVVWEVERGKHYASQVHCAVPIDRNPTHACDGPLRSLRWIEPADLGPASPD